MQRNLHIALLLSSALFSAQHAWSDSVAFEGSSGSLSASATFAVQGNSLIVTLSNTSTNDILQQSDILTAVFFDVSGPLLNLDPASGSAVVPLGSVVLFGTTDPGNVVGGEWSYMEGISASTTFHQNYGISSSGLGIFGSADFPGSNLEGPTGVDGVQYGLTSIGDDPSTGQSAVTGGNALVQSSLVFTLPGLPDGFDPSTSISNVTWEYGTAISPGDPVVVTTVPEPSSIALAVLGCGCLFQAAQTRRRTRQN